MGEFFHIDRDGQRLIPGAILKLGPVLPEWSPQADAINEKFPKGVSRFGAACLCGNNPEHQILVKRELLFEQVRRQYYPTRPSRFSVLFACETLGEARELRNEMSCPDATVWLVESQEAFVADMRWVNYRLKDPDAMPGLESLRIANRYWMGDLTDRPLLECLLSPPVRCIQPVNERATLSELSTPRRSAPPR